MEPIEHEVCYESFDPSDLDAHIEYHTWWKNVEQAFLKASYAGKGIFTNSETVLGVEKEMLVYWVESQDEEFDLFDYELYSMWGIFNLEMITGDFALNNSVNLSQEEITRVGNTILDESKWVDIQWVEIEDDYPKGHHHHTDRLMVIKKGQPLPKGSTGKFLLFAENGFVYKDGSPIIENSTTNLIDE